MRYKGLLAAGLGLCGVAVVSQWRSPVAAPVPAMASHAAAAVLQAAATLSAAQRQQVLGSFTAANAAKWSNLPCGLGCRNGLLLKSLTPAQQAAALAVVRAATGTVARDGFDEIQQIRAADDNLGAVPVGKGRGPGGGPPPGGRPPGQGGPPGGAPPPGGPGGGGGGYSSAIYTIAFLGTPSRTGTWMLQFGGHHLATNITFG